VALCRYLCRKYWKINPVFIDSKIGFENKIEGKSAALIIGDRTIGLDSKYPFVYDLGEMWNLHTGLPFVFATWVSNKKLPDSFLLKFNNALRRGVENRDIVAREYQSAYPGFDVQDYYDKYIDFDLTPDKTEALNLFLSYIEPKTEVVSG
jgi:chorismate dehydratase